MYFVLKLILVLCVIIILLIFVAVTIVNITKRKQIMAKVGETKNNLVEFYAQIVKGSYSRQEAGDKDFGFSSISGFDKEDYETRTFTNLNNVKF